MYKKGIKKKAKNKLYWTKKRFFWKEKRFL